jgi:hypothetical protein
MSNCKTDCSLTNKICNPKTGRCVTKTGTIGKSILKKNMSKQCNCYTGKGSRCKNTVSHSGLYCHLHAKCTKKYTSPTKKKSPSRKASPKVKTSPPTKKKSPSRKASPKVKTSPPTKKKSPSRKASPKVKTSHPTPMSWISQLGQQLGGKTGKGLQNIIIDYAVPYDSFIQYVKNRLKLIKDYGI